MLKHVVRCLLCLCLCASGIGSAWSEETTLNFKNNDEFKKWKTTYSAHTLTFPEGTVFFDSAVRQTQTITNMPVSKGEPVSFVLNEGLVLTGIKLTCKQWTTYVDLPLLLQLAGSAHRSTHGEGVAHRASRSEVAPPSISLTNGNRLLGLNP